MPLKSPLSIKSWILAIDIILLITLLKMLPFDPMVTKGLSLLIFIAILWLTEAIHISITALLVPLLGALLGIFSVKSSLASFANPIIFLFLGGFALAAALSRQALDKAIAGKLIALSKGNLGVATLLLFAVTAALSMWISNTATTAMMLPLALGLLSQLDEKKQRSTYVFVLLGIAYSASIGGIGTLVGSPPNAIAAAQAGLDFLQWMEFGIPVVLVMLPCMVVILYLLLRPELSSRFEVTLEKFHWTRERKLTLAIFALTVCLWIFSRPISQMLGGIKGLDSLTALLAIVLLGITRCAEWKDVDKATDWGVLLLFGGGLTLSVILKITGTSLFLAEQIRTLLAEANLFWVLLVITAFVVALTELASNTASAALLVPVFATVAEALGVSPIVMSVLIGVAASCAFMLPVATPPNAIVFASGHIRQREMMRMGIVLNLICTLLLTIFAYFVGNIVN
ncbi:SLC13 family permease [Dongshaea marina]|uniref:SLC13 family permease n=1 Tax=Dongshaea marina TaxID=2047966 RepID=UPI000D3EAB2C|nr:DASS family sodium-coupled anion symporter [Dongshaea marina]